MRVGNGEEEDAAEGVVLAMVMSDIGSVAMEWSKLGRNGSRLREISFNPSDLARVWQDGLLGSSSLLSSCSHYSRLRG